MFSVQNNINFKKDFDVNLNKIENLVFNFGNLTLLENSVNLSLKDTQLFKKMQHYSKQSELALVSHFDKEWRKVIEKVFKNYLNTTDKYFENKDYENID